MRESGDGQRLQPYRARSLEDGQENSIAAEDGVFETRNHHDLEGNRRLKSADMTWMHSQYLAGCKLLHDQLAGKLNPGGTLAGDFLQQKAVAAKDASAQGLLKANADGDAAP